MNTRDQLDDTTQPEDTRMQEQTSLPVEDTSLPARQVLEEQKDQEQSQSLFVP